MEHLSFPNESAEYRSARIALLDAEIALRRQIEAVAAQRRALPPGGDLPEDYSVEWIGAYQRPERVKLSELFEGKPSIILQSFMFGAERDKPCNGCTHMLDAIDGSARHVGQRAPLYVVAKSPIARLEAWAKARRWPHLIFLSDVDGRYSRSEEHTSELQSPMGISYAVFCLQKKKANKKAHELEILTDKNTTQTNEKLTT